MSWQDAPEVPDWQKAPEVNAPAKAPINSSEKPMSLMDQFKRSGLLGARSLINAVTAIPLAAADFGTGARRLITGESAEQVPSASSMWNQMLDDAGMPKPQSMLEKGTGLATEMLVGSKLPIPTAGDSMGGMSGAPLSEVAANYKPVDPVRLNTLKASQEAGYSVPPSTTNPTVKNKIIESFGGKIATAQDAAAKNQDVTNDLVKSTLGIPESAPLTAESLKALRTEAAPAYEAIKNSGTVVTDNAYSAAIQKIAEKYQGASKSFPGIENDQITKLVDSLNQPSFEADSAIDATKVLREKADSAFRQGDSGLGRAYKAASSAIEDMIQRNLEKTNQTELLQKFKEARQLIAKSYSVEKAFNPATGNVSAVKLAQQLSKNAPLSGGILKAAQFGQAFPKAAQAITDSGSVRNTDVIASMGASALSKQPDWLLYPFARMAARKLMLSPIGQQMAMPSRPANLGPLAGASVQGIANALRK